MALKGTVNEQGRAVIQLDPGDQLVMTGQAMSIPKDLTGISVAQLAQLVTAVNRVLANQRTFAQILGLTISEQ